MKTDIVIHAGSGDKPHGAVVAGCARITFDDGDAYSPWLKTRSPDYLRALAAVATDLADRLVRLDDKAATS